MLKGPDQPNYQGVLPMQDPNYRNMAIFSFSLCSTSLIFYLTQAVLNAGMARAGDYHLSLSFFAMVRRFIGYMILLVSTIIALIAFTPLGLWVFSPDHGCSTPNSPIKQASSPDAIYHDLA